MTQPYSHFAFAIDLVVNEYKLSNPILIAEKIKEDLDMEVSIHQISDYLQVNYEDLEKENRKQYYKQF